jgi:hypothetical protein
MATNLAQGGSWFLEAVDLVEQSDEAAFRRIRDQLAEANSDKSAPLPRAESKISRSASAAAQSHLTPVS